MTPIAKALSLTNERDLLAFCATDDINKADLGILIDDLVQSKRQRNESRAQAYSNFIQRDPLGHDLFQIHQAAAGPDYWQQAAIEKAASSGGVPKIRHTQHAGIDGNEHDGGEDDAASSLENLVAEHRVAFPHKSKSQAYDFVSRTKEGRELLGRSKAHSVAKNAVDRPAPEISAARVLPIR